VIVRQTQPTPKPPREVAGPSQVQVPSRPVTLSTLAQPEPAPTPTTGSLPAAELPALPTAMAAPSEATDLPSQPTRIAPVEPPAPSPDPTELPAQSTVIAPRAPQAPMLPKERSYTDQVPKVPSLARRLVVGGVAAGIVATALLAVAYWPSAPAAPQAVLEISVDAPAVIAVDGKEAAQGMRATVNVRAGVEHTVTVRRSGDAPRTLKVPRLAADEHLPLTVNLR
jgi:hypothetical protein